MYLMMDVDGVVVTQESGTKDPTLRRAWDYVAQKRFGIDPSELNRVFFQPKFIDLLTGKLDLFDVLKQDLPVIGYVGSVDDFVDLWFSSDSRTDADLLTGVSRIRDSRDCDGVYLVTNQEKYRASYLWNIVGLKNHFDGMFYSAQIGYMKTSLKFFSTVDSSLGINGHDHSVVFFDDMRRHIDVACMHGWEGFLYEGIKSFNRNERIMQFV